MVVRSDGGLGFPSCASSAPPAAEPIERCQVQVQRGEHGRFVASQQSLAVSPHHGPGDSGYIEGELPGAGLVFGDREESISWQASLGACARAHGICFHVDTPFFVVGLARRLAANDSDLLAMGGWLSRVWLRGVPHGGRYDGCYSDWRC